jgi:LysM repeat protein
MLLAIILAMAGAVAYFYLSARPDYPEGTFVTTVEDTKILVSSNPKRAVQIVSTPPAPEVIGGEGGTGGAEGGDPTPVPVPSLEPTPVEVPTLVPTLIPTAVPVAQVILQAYTVQPGDTLYSISNRFNTTIALMARYGIDSTDIIAGNVIQVPVANPAFCPGSQPYVVREGDTLSGIARKCGTTVDTLKQLNGFGDVFRLDETSVICVPVQS